MSGCSPISKGSQLSEYVCDALRVTPSLSVCVGVPSAGGWQRLPSNSISPPGQPRMGWVGLSSPFSTHLAQLPGRLSGAPAAGAAGLERGCVGKGLSLGTRSGTGGCGAPVAPSVLRAWPLCCHCSRDLGGDGSQGEGPVFSPGHPLLYFASGNPPQGESPGHFLLAGDTF